MKFLDAIELNPKVSLIKSIVYPFIDMANVSTTMRKPDAILSKSFSSGVKFQKGDTVIARIEPCLQNGKMFLFNDFDYGFGSTEFLVFRAKQEKCDSLFLYYFLKSEYIQKTMIGSMSGATGRQRVNSDVFNHLNITIPSPENQRCIARILSRYDDLIENYQKQIKLLEEAAQCIYKEWFVDFHFPGHENVKVVNGVPEGWERKTLDEFCNVFTGKKNANVGVKNGKYKFFTCGEAILQIDSFIYDGPAIIISGNGSYTGRTIFYEGKFDLYQRTYACVLKENIDTILIYGLYQIVRCSLTSQISGGTHGAAIPYIVMRDITKFQFYCNLDCLFQFSLIIRNLLTKTLNVKKQINFLTEARDRLLPKLMSGEIEV